MRIYEDKNNWEDHYNEWKRLYPTITNDYRKRLFERLIKDYEVNNG